MSKTKIFIKHLQASSYLAPGFLWIKNLKTTFDDDLTLWNLWGQDFIKTILEAEEKGAEARRKGGREGSNASPLAVQTLQMRLKTQAQEQGRVYVT